MLMPPPSSVRIIKKSISDKVCSLQKDRSISLNDSSNINLANERIVDGNKTINIESIEEMITGASRERSIANETCEYLLAISFYIKKSIHHFSLLLCPCKENS